ncbi:phosphopyruvate hydratase [candidate division WWE3 bacterium]|uniref:Enolase n=1 Tax=candidate division WWE3 bacterium TaxID=2053526 RepID=A0A7X9DJN1_UNCKA|nr:phosphopyruvate hydratase [candidate division WWE3 bacterium]
MTPKIKSIDCHKLVNSRGDWTIETHVELTDGSVGVQAIPDGASKGQNEAISIEPEKAVDIVSTVINDALKGEDPFEQDVLDEVLISMDGTPNKSHLGGNSILSVSLAIAEASAMSKEMELYEYLSVLYTGKKKMRHEVRFPTPVFNILNGGKHAHNGLSFQEFMVIPSPKKNFVEAMEMGVDVYHQLKKNLTADNYDIDVGDEGGFAPNGLTVGKALTYIKSAASEKFKPGEDVFFGMDVAAESFYKHGKYCVDEEELKNDNVEMGLYYSNLIKKFELIYIEDPFYEKDIEGWGQFFKKEGKKLMIVGDDLVVTNTKFLSMAISQSLINAVIVKPNQIGTLTETLRFIKMAKENNLATIISHRSGDTAEDTFIADLALAVDADFIKSGAPVRGERVAKYNRLLEIYFKD